MDSELKRIKTLEYATTLFNHLGLIGARTIMRELGKDKVLDFIESRKEEPELVQLFLEYAYVGQTIGFGIREKILDPKVIFGI